MTADALSSFRLTDRCVVVTGGGDGIGRATAELLASVGARIAVLDRDAAKASDVAAAITASGSIARAYPADVTDEAGLEAAFAALSAELGPCDILVNNAGIAVRASAATLSVDDWNRVVAVNLTGMFLAARIAARQMTGRGGAIVNTASIMGLSGGLYPNVAYQTTKGGVVNMTRALALEWAPDGIRVNAVAPTFVRTSLTVGLLAKPDVMATIVAATPLGRLAEPVEIANAVLFLASPAAAMVTGTILPVDGGYLAR
jgi:NAD(P)-dependent dehydrogenase (short-subunit alcohol dehydrogenase family)